MEFYERHLPHWRVDDVIYFVTWRLRVGSMPLDPDERTIVSNAIEHFHEQRYRLVAYVVMDDHVHVLVGLSQGTELHRVVHSWKSFTANKLQRQFEREQAVWQDECYDHIIRSQDELHRSLDYIASNPSNRWSDMDEYPWLRLFDIGK